MLELLDDPPGGGYVGVETATIGPGWTSRPRNAEGEERHSRTRPAPDPLDFTSNGAVRFTTQKTSVPRTHRLRGQTERRLPGKSGHPLHRLPAESPGMGKPALMDWLAVR